MKKYIFLSVCGILVASCNNEHKTMVSRTRVMLSQSVNTFSRLEFQDLKIDLRDHKDQSFLVKDVIPGDVSKSEFVDGWGNPLLCKFESGYIYVWSCGRNHDNDLAKKDDIFVQVILGGTK